MLVSGGDLLYNGYSEVVVYGDLLLVLGVLVVDLIFE